MSQQPPSGEDATDLWWVDEDSEFGRPLLRWGDTVCIAQVLIEDEDIGEAAYAALVAHYADGRGQPC